MAEVKEVKKARAVSKYNRLSPRKARLVADLIRGKHVLEALKILYGINNKPKRFIEKTLKSAIANFKNKYPDYNEENLYISEIYIDEGPRLKRYRPRAMGRAYPIIKPTAHITVVVSPIEEK